MVLINHLPPLIMSQLPLIHHYYQSLARRETLWGVGRRQRQKQTWSANKVPLKKFIQNAIVTFFFF